MTDDKNINDIIKPLNRIANTLDEVLTLVKKDMEDSKARITAQWDNELDKKEVVKSDENFNYSQLELPFPEVE
jgi:ElaB/YqjD/DUF883 family membrane-anchored ribosome-binding protein